MNRRLMVAGAVCGAVVGASLAPVGGGSGASSLLAGGGDELLHAAGYAAVASSVAWAARVRTAAGLAVVVAAAALLGGAVELLQFAVPTRHPSAVDAAVNCAGAVVGAVGRAAWLRLRGGRAGPRPGA
ncbi:VanZ family protein [Halobaculum sp. P14]|uniref:VanZ family protein n=1 Tax=Halobaculum sp. P14 TaxID=3421638 RepID=UPI003EBE9BFD